MNLGVVLMEKKLNNPDIHRKGTSCQDVGVDCIPRKKEPKSSTIITTSTTTITFTTTTTEKASPAQIIDRLLSGNLKTNQQRAKRLLPPEKFRKVLPGLDAPQTYVDFILAIGKFPHLCSWRKCSGELSAIIAFANKSRCAGGKTTNLHIRQHFDLGNKESEVQGSCEHELLINPETGEFYKNGDTCTKGEFR